MVSNYFKTKALSDITFICSDNTKVQAHRTILAGRSEVFEKLFTTDEKQTEIKMSEIDGQTMEELLRFIYTNEVENLEKHAENLIHCAELYKLPELKEMCSRKLIDRLSPYVVFDYLDLAYKYFDDKLRDECLEFLNT